MKCRKKFSLLCYFPLYDFKKLILVWLILNKYLIRFLNLIFNKKETSFGLASSFIPIQSKNDCWRVQELTINYLKVSWRRQFQLITTQRHTILLMTPFLGVILILLNKLLAEDLKIAPIICFLQLFIGIFYLLSFPFFSFEYFFSFCGEHW